MTTIQFNNSKALFTKLSPTDVNFIRSASHSYITANNIIQQIQNLDLPVKKEMAAKRILDFLEYLDQKIIDNNSTEIPIDKKTWIEYFTLNRYQQYQEILSQLKILTTVMYKKGIYIDKNGQPINKNKDFAYCKELGLCKIFQVHNSYLNDENYIIVLFDDKRKSTSITIDERLENKLSPKFINTIKNLKLDIAKAIQVELNTYHKQKISFAQLKHRISRIFAVQNSRKISTGDKVNRIYHSFTNLSKISRQHFNHNFFEIDIVNCQPTLLIAYLNKNKLGIDTNYINDCESGTFYERFIDIIDDKYRFGDDLSGFELSRKETKDNIYRKIFFGFTKSSEFNHRFKELYPLVWLELKKIKKSSTSLASILQNIEAELFNSLVPKKSKMYFTLFDAIYYTNAEDTSDLTIKIEKFFRERNVKVKIKVKTPK